MSASYHVATMAANEIAPDRIAVLDSKNLSTGIGLIVIKATQYIARGMGVKEIEERLRTRYIHKVRSSFLVDSTTYLHRGGRCSAVAAFGATALSIKPSIVVENGKMRPDVKFQGSLGRALIKYAKKLTPDLLKARKSRVFITHSGISDDVLESVRSFLEELNYFENICITRAGGVISSHCGPNTLGVLFYEK
jgi:DegV family protein with EDD domain